MKSNVSQILLSVACSCMLAACSRSSDAPASGDETQPSPDGGAAVSAPVPPTPPAAPSLPPDPAKVLAATVTGVYKSEERTNYSVKHPSVETIAKAPYIGAIAVDADTGRVLFEDNAEALGLPASMTKMMDLLLIQERIEAGTLATNDIVHVSRRAYETGGSQVYLDPKESFPVEDMLYALMIQSANDVAVALAEHVAGSCEAMVALMNRRAAELGMVNTHFESVHGLPADKGLPNDITTPRDMAVLALELCKHPDILRYTGTAYRQFRAGTSRPFDMRTHNPFLQQAVPGCDGLKTGYTKYAGYSVAISIARGGHRIVLVVMGVPDKKTRDAKLRELLVKAETAVHTP